MGPVYNIGQLQKKRMNNHLLFAFLGDSQVTGGTTAYPVGWPAAYLDVSEKTKILYRDDRTSNFTTLRWLNYDPNDAASNNRFPGYGTVGVITAQFAGFDQPFMWYMRENSNRPVGLMKWALGGTTLLSRSGTANDWDPGNTEMFYWFANYYSNVHNTDGVNNSRLRAAMVALGTNDCHVSVWNNTNFRAAIPIFVQALRSVTRNPTLPIYFVQVRSDLSTFDPVNYPAANVTQCRQAWVDFTLGGANAISGCFLKDWEFLGGTSDGVHFDADVYEGAALDIAEDFLTLYNTP